MIGGEEGKGALTSTVDEARLVRVVAQVNENFLESRTTGFQDASV